MSFKRIFTGVVLGLMILMSAVVAFSAERVIEATLDQDAVVAVDKNGNEYTRLIIPETNKLQGVEYEIGVACMAFGEMSPEVADKKAGDKVKLIVAEREYQGRKSYTILKVL